MNNHLMVIIIPSATFFVNSLSHVPLRPVSGIRRGLEREATGQGWRLFQGFKNFTRFPAAYREGMKPY